MFALSQAAQQQIQPEHPLPLSSPLFTRNQPLWCKEEAGQPPIFFKKLKKYEFTKLGKTFGF